jgi:hypothetical protein
LTEPNGRETNWFRRIFRIPYTVFRYQLLDLAVETWWTLWKDDKVDCCGYTTWSLNYLEELYLYLGQLPLILL